ncbi:MAG: hypothetical protein IKA51_05710 [Clostridia bacterium]|nr:hypothetical protein [Clostridia bacterium]
MENDKLFYAKLSDLASAAKSGKTRFSAFLSESEQAEADLFLKREGACFLFYGGNEKVKRKIAGVSPRELEFSSFPVSVIRATGRDIETLTHRDLLGALMALGLTRESVGDIVVDKSSLCAYIFVTENAKRLILSDLKSAGRVYLTVSEVDGEKIVLPDDEFDDIALSVSSFRADAVLAALLNLSREKAASLIDARSVVLNGSLLAKHEKEITEGDTLSVKGFGKFKVDFAAPKGKKGRIGYLIKKYK